MNPNQNMNQNINQNISQHISQNTYQIIDQTTNQNAGPNTHPHINDIEHAKSNGFYLDPTIYTGRPTLENSRLPKEIRAYDLLDALHMEYLRLDHSPADTIEACHGVDKLLGIQICKNLFLCNAQKTNFYLLMISGNKKFKTAAITKQIGCSRLSFAPPEYMEKFLDITPGSVSVLGLMNDKENRVRLLIDKDVIENHPYIGCHPCINTSSLRIKTRDLLDKFLPAVHHEYTLVNLPNEP